MDHFQGPGELCSPVSAQLEAPAAPRSSHFLSTVCLSLLPHKSGMASPEMPTMATCGMQRVAQSKGERASMLTDEGRTTPMLAQVVQTIVLPLG